MSTINQTLNADKTINNEFEQELINNGYRFYPDYVKKSIRIIQKRFEDENGIKYHITCHHYNFAKQFPDSQAFKDQTTDRYTFEVQFNMGEEGKSQTIDTSFSADFIPYEDKPLTTLKEVEAFFEKMFVDFRCKYYELKMH